PDLPRRAALVRLAPTARCDAANKPRGRASSSWGGIHMFFDRVENRAFFFLPGSFRGSWVACAAFVIVSLCAAELAFAQGADGANPPSISIKDTTLSGGKLSGTGTIVSATS